jgi:hypothetical protein
LTITKPQNATLIDTISAGYSAINRRIWLVLVPIALNVYLFFGAQLSLGPLIEDFHGWLTRVQADIPQPSELQAQSTDVLIAFSRVDMRQPLTVLNYIPLTIYGINVVGTGGNALGLPMVQSMPQLIDTRRTDTVQIASVGSALLAFVLFNALALPLSVTFLTGIAAAVRGGKATLAAWLREAGRSTLALLACIGILAGVGLALGLPFMFFVGVLLWLSPAIGAFVLLLLWVGLFWIRIYIGFAREAIVVGGQGPLRAIYTSFNVVRFNFWATLGFLALSVVITLGSGVIWMQLSGSTAGLIVAIVGSAYVGSGLLAARMAFFQERLRRWKSMAVKSRVVA